MSQPSSNSRLSGVLQILRQASPTSSSNSSNTTLLKSFRKLCPRTLISRSKSRPSGASATLRAIMFSSAMLFLIRVCYPRSVISSIRPWQTLLLSAIQSGPLPISAKASLAQISRRWKEPSQLSPAFFPRLIVQRFSTIFAGHYLTSLTRVAMSVFLFSSNAILSHAFVSCSNTTKSLLPCLLCELLAIF